MGEMKSSLKENESLLIEEDGTAPEKAKESKKSEMDAMIKVLRKDREVGKNEVLREFLMPIALYVSLNSDSTIGLTLRSGLPMLTMKFDGVSSN
jgi:transcription initiation factor TFIID subunit 2